VLSLLACLVATIAGPPPAPCLDVHELARLADTEALHHAPAPAAAPEAPAEAPRGVPGN
jgi:hypothetical protein